MQTKTLKQSIPALILPPWADSLPEDWSWRKLDNICTEVVDCPHSTPKLVDYGPHLMARTSDILGGVFRTDDVRRVSKATYEERVRRTEPRYGDILYSREGTYFGIAAEVPPNAKICLGQRMVLLRPNQECINPSFLRYWLNSPRIQSHIHGYRDGTVAERLNLPTIKKLPVCLPPLSEQCAIAHILGSLDDKIELNRKMNQTLEAMARAIFKSWFVDFDPVRAKANGKQPPGLNPEIAALFPDSFQDSELGEIPMGWKVQSFTHTIDVIGGGTPKTSINGYWGGDIPWYSVGDTPSSGEIFVISTGKSITQSGLVNSSTRILPVGTTIISARGTVGNLALVGVPMAMNQSCYGLVDRRKVHGYFLYFATSAVISTLRQRTHGTVFNTITRGTLDGLRVIAPPEPFMIAYEEIIGSMLLRIMSNLRESNTLAVLRDTLLPKLISGELRVKDAERIVGAIS